MAGHGPVVAVMIIVAASAVATSWPRATTNPGTTTLCITAAGQAFSAYLSILSDSDSLPMGGLGVTAYPISSQHRASPPIEFTTNGTEWYSLPIAGAGAYNVTVSYLRHDYNLTMMLPASADSTDYALGMFGFA